MNLERRTITSEFELRKAGADAPTVVAGHGAVFNKRSQKLFEPRLGPFIEVVKDGAFTKTLKESDIRALVNHDASLLLGRTSAGTLRVAQDALGLAYDFDLPDTSYGRDLEVSMARRDITQSSFSFSVVGADGESWSTTEDGFPLRSLNELRVGDVSPVTYPAYLDTDVSLQMRMALSGIAERRGISDAEAEAIAQAGQLGRLVEGKRVDVRSVADARTIAREVSHSLALSALSNRQRTAAEAIQAAFEDVHLRDMTEDWAAYEQYGTNPGTFRVSYTIADDGTVTLGDPEPVAAVTTYTPVANGGRSTSTPGQTPTSVELATRRLELLRRRYPAA